MIFVTLGSQKFQFNRLLREIDNLIEKKVINQKVIAQIGYSDYKPKFFEYEMFMDREQHLSLINNSNIVISHGGTGAIINAIKKDKKVIAVPRLEMYGEHVDDHQLQIVKQFSDMNLICGCTELSELGELCINIGNQTFKKYYSNTKVVLESIENFIENL